jgi:uncharacterized membrane protein YadS
MEARRIIDVGAEVREGRPSMSDTALGGNATSTRSRPNDAWWSKDDWWAVVLGVGLIAVGYALYLGGSGIGWIAVTPAKWASSAQLAADFAVKWPRYLAQFALWLVLTSIALSSLGYNLRNTVPAFVFLYVVSILIFALGQWDQAVKFNLEPPLVALLFGLVLANTGALPRRFDDGFRVEFYIKLGVVLLGATLPFTLILWAGPVAVLQAAIVSIVTFSVIFAVAGRLGLDQRFAATLGVGGAVCGVSAAIAIAAAVGARKQDAAAVISIVILWAIVMIFVLPFAAAGLHLPAGVGGAWIGTSEFADAAGLAAAQAYDGIAARASGATAAHPEQAVAAFTLMKVVGRDIWIGIWAIVLSIVATTRWETGEVGARAGAGEIWRRFPKFVIGFLIASIAITLISQGLSRADYGKTLDPGLVTPIKNLRTWAFAFGFLSIGLTTRLRDLSGVAGRPLAAFTAGVLVNVPLGLLLSAVVFGGYWAGLGQ